MIELENRHARILVVDDEEVILTALSETLRREGYQVDVALDAMAAGKCIDQHEFTVVLTDQQMPEITGLEFLQLVKERQPDATRILITGVLTLNTVIDSINQGEIYRFIVKPWLREDLLATVRNAVQRHNLVRHARELQSQTQAANQKLAAHIARVAEQNQQLEKLNTALQQNLDRSVQLCLKTLDAYWPVLSNQAHRVQELCRAMGETLNLSREDRHVLDIAALLHDIGLIEVPRELIRKWRQHPESLNDAELEQIQHHPVLGQELVGFVEHLSSVGKVIRAHHERFDGLGYPDRLHGDGIPWLARLLAIAVVYATYPRESAAADFIKANSGTAFDPDAVRAFLRSLPHATMPRRRKEVLLSELRAGMVLAEGIYSSSGLLLVSHGQPLTEPYIDKLRSHDRVSPLNHSLVVFA